MSDRIRGAIAVTLDPDLLLEYGRKHLTEQHPGMNPEFLTHGPLPQMLIPVNRGEAAVVNNEGVGLIADEDRTIGITFTYQYTYITIQLSLDDEVGQAATETKIDLADGIRTFGDRLDGNHYRWANRYDHNQ